MADFDWWTHSRLEALAGVLRECTETIPSATNLRFWSEAAASIGFDADAEGSLEELAADVHSEMEGWQEECSHRGVFFGDLNLAESRLMLTIKGVRGIAYVASHEMDTLWHDDGIQYHTLIVTPTTAPRPLFIQQLSNLCSFVQKNSPALVCSSCPKLLAAVAAATVLHAGDATTPDKALENIHSCGLNIAIGEAEREALDLFSEALQTTAGTAPPYKIDLRVQISPGKRPANAEDEDDDNHCGLSPKLRALSATEGGGMTRMRVLQTFKRDKRLSEEAL